MTNPDERLDCLDAALATDQEIRAALQVLLESAACTFLNLDTRLRLRLDLWTSDERATFQDAITRAEQVLK